MLGIALLLFTIIKPKFLFLALALLAGMLFSFFKIASELQGEANIKRYYGEEITITGEVTGDPETDDKTTKLKLIQLQIDAATDAATIPTAGTVYVTLNKTDKIKRTDIVTLKGELKEGFSTYAGSMYRPQIIKILRKDPGDAILTIRNNFAEEVKTVIKEPEANLGLSYLLGMKEGLDNTLDENLRIVGLTHMIVASGAHLSILVEIAKKLFGKISRFAGLTFSIIFIVLFMIMVGWTPSIMRAGVMTILSLACWYVGRKMAPARMILLVAAGTLLVNPSFITNAGWLLSFASFSGIMILGPIITKWFYGERKPGLIASTIITTLAATIMTFPITLFFYGQISLISIIANLLILPTLPFIMGLVFAAGLTAPAPFLGAVLGTIATWGLDYHIKVVEFFASMKQFLIAVDKQNPWFFLAYLVVAAIIATHFIKTKNASRRQNLVPTERFELSQPCGH